MVKYIVNSVKLLIKRALQAYLGDYGMKTKYIIWQNYIKNQIISTDIDENIKSINKQLLEELENCTRAENPQEEIYERFYKNVEFGTGGLRGILGAGSNRMNIYTVAKATQGIADYILDGEYIKDSPIIESETAQNPAVAIAYDSRINSEVFAKITAEVLTANDIDVYLYEELMPTPALSFAVRHFKCAMGIMITASHNPAKYNGYKVYDNSGCQVTLTAAEKIYGYIEKLDIFNDVKHAGGTGEIRLLGKDIAELYLDAVQAESCLNTPNLKETLKNLSVVYTPLNGAGNKPVRRILERLGVFKVHMVKEQELPDGNFSTCPYPNPEKREALALGLSVCKELAEKAAAAGMPEDIPDLLLATDPDCDRIGIAICEFKDGRPDYRLLSGNEVGVMLLDFLIATKVKTGLKEKPCAVTTIVSTKMAEAIAEKHGVKMIFTLTGFKFIGEQIAFLENEHREEEYLFGFEESYGYLSGTYVRDKDAVNGSMLICEMAAYYKDKGMTLAERLEQLYQEYGYYKNELIDFTFEGSKGMELMNQLMQDFRENLENSFIGKPVIETADYQEQERHVFTKDGSGKIESIRPIDLPKSDVMEVILEDGSSFTVRPSGTEPKLKIYLSAKGKTAQESEEIIAGLIRELTNKVNR